MERRPQKREKLADMLYSAILKSIVNGELKEGDRLPGEEAMSETYKVSRPTIREALARLRAGGLIVSRQGSGSYVGKPPGQRTLEFPEPGSIADLRRCFEYRIAMESGAAAVAATMHEAADLEQIEANLREHGAALAAGAVAAEEDFALHLAIADATRNPLFVTALHSIRPHAIFSTTLCRTLVGDKREALLAATQRQYREIVDAIAARDAEAAGRRMREHVAGAMERVFIGT